MGERTIAADGNDEPRRGQQPRRVRYTMVIECDMTELQAGDFDEAVDVVVKPAGRGLEAFGILKTFDVMK